jgi:hypothetical protein
MATLMAGIAPEGKEAGLVLAFRQKLQGAFDREQWEGLRKGVDYTEEALPIAEQADGGNSLVWAMALELLRYGGIAVLVVALVLLVLKLLGLVKFKGPANKKNTGEVLTEQMPNAQSSIESLLQALVEAREAADYREAIRLYYQIALHHLHAGGKVNVVPEKTNWEYVHELNEASVADKFGFLTTVFEQVWFGKGQANSHIFASYEPYFEQFIQHHKADGKA